MGLERGFAPALGHIRGAQGGLGPRQPLNAGSYILIPYLNNVTKRSFPLKNREEQNTEPKLEPVGLVLNQFRAPGRARSDGSHGEKDPSPL